MAAFSVASVGVFLFEVATDSSRSAPLLDLAVYSAVFIAGLVGIIALIGLLVGKEIDITEKAISELNKVLPKVELKVQ